MVRNFYIAVFTSVHCLEYCQLKVSVISVFQRFLQFSGVPEFLTIFINVLNAFEGIFVVIRRLVKEKHIVRFVSSFASGHAVSPIQASSIMFYSLMDFPFRLAAAYMVVFWPLGIVIAKRPARQEGITLFAYGRGRNREWGCIPWPGRDKIRALTR